MGKSNPSAQKRSDNEASSDRQQAIGRAKDVHGESLGLAAAASSENTERVAEHAAEIRDALEEIESILGVEDAA